MAGREHDGLQIPTREVVHVGVLPPSEVLPDLCGADWLVVAVVLGSLAFDEMF